MDTPRDDPDDPNPPLAATVALVIGAYPMVAGGLVKCCAPSVVRPVLLE